MTAPAGFEPVELAGEWPSGAPAGVFTCHDEGGQLVIDRADPRVVISALVIDEAAFGRRPEVTLTMTGESIADGHVGALLKVRAANRQVIYRLTKWYPSIRAYLGEFV